MNQYLFVLGREAKLCFAEIETVLRVVDPAATVTNLPSGVALVQCGPNGARTGAVARTSSVAQRGEAGLTLDPSWWIGRLGGTRLIARVLGSANELTADALAPFIPSTVRELALSSPDVPARERMKLLLQLKRHRPGFRYRPTEDAYLASGLSERLLRRPDGLELILVSDPTPGVGFTIAEVVAVQDTRSWAARDRGLPAPDPVAGMLPPKLARIMVNLAEPARHSSLVIPDRILDDSVEESFDASNPGSSIQSDRQGDLPVKDDKQPKATLLDPFCGSGQIPIEALRTGWEVVASDFDTAALERTRQNVEWVQTRSRTAASGHWQTVQSNVADLPTTLAGHSVDAIVTEPDLGPPLRSATAVPSDAKLSRVTATIRAALTVSRQLLRPGGRCVIVIPVIAGHRIAERLDESDFSGYRRSASLHYARPDSRVERELFVLDRV